MKRQMFLALGLIIILIAMMGASVGLELNGNRKRALEAVQDYQELFVNELADRLHVEQRRGASDSRLIDVINNDPSNTSYSSCFLVKNFQLIAFRSLDDMNRLSDVKVDDLDRLNDYLKGMGYMVTTQRFITRDNDEYIVGIAAERDRILENMKADRHISFILAAFLFISVILFSAILILMNKALNEDLRIRVLKAKLKESGLAIENMSEMVSGENENKNKNNYNNNNYNNNNYNNSNNGNYINDINDNNIKNNNDSYINNNINNNNDSNNNRNNNKNNYKNKASEKPQTVWDVVQMLESGYYREYRFRAYLNASHAIIINGSQGEMHPHTFEISLSVVKVRDKFIEFNDIEKTIEDFLRPYQDKRLNDCPPFDIINPTLENISENFKNRLSSILSDKGWVLLRYEMSETPSRSYVINLLDENEQSGYKANDAAG
jgi:6-pyruvoyltetrahydropterin/6-carboxytetrahydropterin synthase